MGFDFLTLEDVNTTLFNNQEYWWHTIDTALISDDESYTDVKYDFCEVSRRTYQTARGNYEYTLKIYNPFWSLGIYAVNSENESQSTVWFEVDAFDGNKIYIYTDYPSIKVFLYMGPVKLTPTIGSVVEMGCYFVDPTKEVMELTLKELNTNPKTVYYKERGNDTLLTKNYSFSTTGYHQLTADYGLGTVGLMFVKLKKTDFQFTCTDTLTIGKVNKVKLGTLADYKPEGDLIGEYTPTITVEYEGQTLEVEYDQTLEDYCFSLDLTDKTTAGNVQFKVIVEDNEVLNHTENTVKLSSDYITISSYSDLASALTTGGIKLFKLGSNITLSGNITISHDVKILGNNKTIDMDSHSFIMNQNVHVIGENITFDKGNSAFTQKIGSRLDLTGCTFTSCTGTNYNGLGSCIYCDVDFENLSNPDDFETNLEDCYFHNCHSNIFHGGMLNINNCRFHNTDISVVDKNHPAFIYQTDGAASITNSIFDIDYTSTSLCTNESSVGFAQCLVMCGETAWINGSNYTDLSDDNTIPLLDEDYRNRSHVFVKYYYPAIEACVYSSPVSGFEDRSCCHAVSGLDWVFKDNVKVTRASADTQNENRKIVWED